MSENNTEKNIRAQRKFTKYLTKKEENKAKSKTKTSNKDYDLTDKEYNERKKRCFFFLRRTFSQNDILKNINFKPISNSKRKKRFKELIDTKNNNLYDELNKSEFPKKGKKKEEIIYDNLQPKTIWLNCKKIYNKCKNECKPLLKESITNLKQIQNKKNNLNIITRKNKYGFSNIKASSTFVIPSISQRFERKENRAQSLLFRKRTKIEFNKISKSVKDNKNNNTNKNNDSNFVKCMEEKIKENFVNRGINYIIENRNLSKITGLPKFKTEEEIFIFKDANNKSIVGKKNDFSLGRKKRSVVFRAPFSLESIKKAGVNKYKYKIDSFFEIANDKNTNTEEDEEENDLQIISQQGNIIIRELLFSKKENLENYKENQSIFSFFYLKKIFEINDFHIFGVINGKGKESKKFSRLLKDVLIEKFSEEKNYFNAYKTKQKLKSFKFKNDFIYNTLTLEGNIFIKNIFNSLIDDLKKRGVDVEETGATLFIVILIKDKIISLKVGDMYSYFIYSISNENNINHLITKNPHLEHLISNIIEQDRFEENKCEFSLKKDESGKNYYEIICKDSEIQKYINENEIKFTRMVGFLKLKKIGIIGEPDIQIFSMNFNQRNEKKLSKSVSKKDFSFSNNLMKYQNINYDEGKLKFIMIGNNELFEYLKANYYIKEIYESLLKDEMNNRNKDNIKYFFNLKNKVKQLVKDSADIHKKYMKAETFKDRCMALITLT